MKFKSNIEIQAGLEDASGSPGTVNQLLSSTATGTAWIDPSTIVAEAATLVVIACKNTSGAAIAQGTPVYQTGTVGATATIEIAPADALISANKLPAIGLLQTALNNNGFGFVVITGELTNFTTSPIDGVVPTTGDKIFVKSGGGLTLTKPTGEGNGIQNMGLVGKVSGGNAGSITVSSIMRTNDVPNLPEGRIWVGDGNTIVSDTVYVDEPNNRVGIGTGNPQASLQIGNNVGTSSERLDVRGNSSGNYVASFEQDHITGYGLLIDTDGTLVSQPVLKIKNASSELFYVGSNGNVGIGTSSPSAKLHITKDNTTGNALLITNSGSSRSLEINHNADGSGVSDEVVRIMNDGTRLFTIESDGNVGIGTTSPGARLDVKETTSDVAGEIIVGGLIASDNVPFGKISFANTATANTQTNDVLASIAGEKVGSSNRGELTFLTSDSAAPAERMRISSAGAIKFNDYGAGTLVTDASGNITVSSGGGAGGPYLPLSAGSSYPLTGNLFIEGASTPTITIKDTTNNLEGRIRVANNYMYIEADNSNAVVSTRMVLKTDGVEALYLDGNQNAIFPNGNVGVGTTGPGYPFSLESATTGLISRIYNTNADGQGLLIRAGATTSATRVFQAASSDDTKIMTVNSNGNVGIGTTSPSEKLDVVGNIELNGALYIGSRGIYQQENTDVDGLELVANASTSLYRAAFFDYVIQKTGNVRAGTVFACNDGGSVEYTETSTNDIGDTSDVVLSVDISGGNMRLLADAATSGWSVKSLIRAI